MANPMEQPLCKVKKLLYNNNEAVCGICRFLLRLCPRILLPQHFSVPFGGILSKKEI